jgi:hypothetical protein
MPSTSLGFGVAGFAQAGGDESGGRAVEVEKGVGSLAAVDAMLPA